MFLQRLNIALIDYATKAGGMQIEVLPVFGNHVAAPIVAQFDCPSQLLEQLAALLLKRRPVGITGPAGDIALGADAKIDFPVCHIESTPLNVAVEKNPHLHTALMDAAETFPFKDNTFHTIYAGDIIEHLFDTSLFLNECYRCLKSDGILLLTTPNLASLEDRVRFLFGKSPRQINPTHEFLYLHIRPFTYHKMKEVLTQRGFCNFKICTNLVRIKLGNFRKDSLLLAKLFPSLGRSLIVAACARKEAL